MRTWISACIIVLTLGCAAASAELTAEARQCFEWFSTLGYPDVKDAPWAEIAEERSVAQDDGSRKLVTTQCFILSDTGKRFHALEVDLDELIFTKGAPKKPDSPRFNYKKKPFFQMAKAKLSELRKFPRKSFF